MLVALHSSSKPGFNIRQIYKLVDLLIEEALKNQLFA
jgi:hypothetical protein